MAEEYKTVRHAKTGQLGKARRCYLAYGRGEIRDVRRVLWVPLEDDPFCENEVPENIKDLRSVEVAGAHFWTPDPAERAELLALIARSSKATATG